MAEQYDTRLQELISRIRELELKQEQNRQELQQLKTELRVLVQAKPDSFSTEEKLLPVSNQKTFSIEQFIGLKLLNFAGIIVLLIGIAIGIKFAIDRDLISPLLRIILAYAAAGTLLSFSLFLRKKYAAFSAVLFSGAMATFYFTTYGAFDFYSFFARPFTFSAMVLLTIFTVWGSLRENRQEIAVLALVGAYGIPFLVGGNTGNITALFSYLFIINSGILFLSFRKEWNWLKFLSFITSWLILISWLVIKYDYSWYNTGLLFAILFFIQFTCTICGFHILRKKELQAGDYLFTGALSFFLYSSILLLYKGIGTVLIFSTITLMTTLLHAVLATVVYFMLKAYRTLSLFYAFAALVFLILFIPIRFEGITVSFLWIVLAVLLFIAGLWLKTRSLRFLSIGLFAITLMKLVALDSLHFSSVEKVITYISIGIVLLVISFLYQKYKGLLFGKD